MNKYLFVVLAMVAGLTVSCHSHVPHNAFKVHTGGRYYLLGIPLPVSVPTIPFVALNLKTNTAPGTPGTTGTIPEFNPGGQNVHTDRNGNSYAVNAVLPAVWNATVAPHQRCNTTPTAVIVSGSAVRGGTYNIRCKLHIRIGLRVEPSVVDSGGLESALTVSAKDDAPRFLNAQNLRVLYYKQVSGEEYILEGEKQVTSISSDGTTLGIAVPNYTSNSGLTRYQLVVVEDGANNVYIGDGELQVNYPYACPVRRPVCPRGKTWDPDLCSCVGDLSL